MTTFSKLVDDIVLELLRPDMRTAICDYVNQTIRELHFRPATNLPIAYDANRYEDQVTVDATSPWLWTIPSVTRFQKLETVYCPEIGIYIEPKAPRLMQAYSVEPFAQFGYYRTGPAFAFSGVVNGYTLQLSYFQYPVGLTYKTVAQREIQWDPTTDTYVLIVGGGVPTEAQLEAETNWFLQRWEHTVKEGTRAKAWKRMGDDARTRTAYGSFESARTQLWNTEAGS